MQKKQEESIINLHKYKIKLLVLLLLIAAVGYIVYCTGGTEVAFTHLMYFPIIIAAFHFGIKGALSAALLGGLALGPWMPKNVTDGISQQPVSWIFRMIIFMIIGVMIAELFERLMAYRKTEVDRSYSNIMTGLPNSNRLKLDLEKLIDQKIAFSLIGFRIINMDDINRYLAYDVGIESAKRAADLLKGYVNETVYSIYINEFAAVVPSDGTEAARLIGEQYLNRICEPLLIDAFHVELIVKGGIVHYPVQAVTPNDLIRKMGIALGQGGNEIGLHVYDTIVERRNKERSEVTTALFRAIKNEEFFMVYQPKQSLQDNRAMGVEALLRWNHGFDRQINTGEFIAIAEEVGVVSEITKWVIKNTLEQMKKWREEGAAIKVAINFSSKDLRDCSVVGFLIETIARNNLDPAMVEIELTERSILENVNETVERLNMLRQHGIKIALDDFGTGYNSLIGLLKIPLDYIKIDKTFVDDMEGGSSKVLIETAIEFAHKTGKQVIAEGVETSWQLESLRNMGCDYIQGYYFSKPLLPEMVKQFVLSSAAPRTPAYQ